MPSGAARERRHLEAPRPNVVWRADVCQGLALKVNGKSVPLRIHALLDDHRRYIFAMQARSTQLRMGDLLDAEQVAT